MKYKVGDVVWVKLEDGRWHCEAIDSIDIKEEFAMYGFRYINWKAEKELFDEPSNLGVI